MKEILCGDPKENGVDMAWNMVAFVGFFAL